MRIADAAAALVPSAADHPPRRRSLTDGASLKPILVCGLANVRLSLQRR